MRYNHLIRFLSVALVCLMLAAVLPMTGCGGNAKNSDAGDYAREETYEYAVPAEEEAYYGDGWDTVTSSEYKTENDTAMPEQANPYADAKLIYEGSLEIETTEFEAAVKELKERTEKAGGYIENSSSSDYGTYRYAHYTVRVPQEQYRYFCDTAGDIGHVRSFDESVRNVSAEYFDNETRLQSAKTMMETLQELLKKAENMEDIITIQQEINSCQWEIDYYSGNLRNLDSLIGFSTINISLREVSRITDDEKAPIGFGEEISQAFKNASKGLKEGARDLAISFVRNIYGWILFAVIVVIVWIVVKRIIKKSKEKKAKADAVKYAESRKQYEMQQAMIAQQQSAQQQEQPKQ